MKERVRFPPKAMDIINHTYYISGEPVLLQDTHGDLGIMSSDLSWNATGISPVYTHRLTRIGTRVKLTRIRVCVCVCVSVCVCLCCVCVCVCVYVYMCVRVCV